MELLKPEIGLIFWTAVIILLIFFLLSKFAWKPILQALGDRERRIDTALRTADKTREDMNNLKSQHEELLRQAREERSAILKEAKDAKDAIIAEAREKAKLEGNKMIMEAKREIENQKMAALVEVKNQVGNMVIEVSEKVLQRELHEKKDQMRYIDELLDKSKLN